MSEIDCEMAILAYVLETSSEDDDNDRNDARSSSKRRVWRKNWLGSRETEGFCAKLLLELRANEPELYRNCVRMTVDQFDHLLGLVTPFIQKEDTNMRMSIPASDRLILTLRFLATGDNFRSLQYLFRIPQTTISRIIPEVLEAIYKVLVDDFVKVIVSSYLLFFPFDINNVSVICTRASWHPRACDAFPPPQSNVMFRLNLSTRAKPFAQFFVNLILFFFFVGFKAAGV